MNQEELLRFVVGVPASIRRALRRIRTFVVSSRRSEIESRRRISGTVKPSNMQAITRLAGSSPALPRSRRARARRSGPDLDPPGDPSPG